MARGLVSGLAIIIALAPAEAWADPVTIIAAAISATSISAAGVVAFSWATFGVSLAIGAAGKLLQKKPKAVTSGTTAIKSSGYNQQIRQPISAREIVYGNMRKSGPIIYAGVSSNNENLFVETETDFAKSPFASMASILLLVINPSAPAATPMPATAYFARAAVAEAAVFCRSLSSAVNLATQWLCNYPPS